jgi:hypothetical protein
MVVGTRRPSSNKLPKSPTPSTPPPRRSTRASTTPSSRNKVVPSTPPAAKYPPSTPDSVADESSVSSLGSYISSTDGQHRAGLPLFLQKQLAIDIEKAGGIKNLTTETVTHTLCRLLDQRPDVYGKQGDSKRSQIQKKVWSWKQLHKEGKYIEKVLNRFQVKSFDTLQFEERNRKKNPRKRGDDETSISSSSSDSAESISVSGNKEEGKHPPPVIDTPIIPQHIATITKMSDPPPNTPVPKGAGTFLLFVFVLLGFFILFLLTCSSYYVYSCLIQNASSSTSNTLRGIERCWSFQ